MCIYIYIYLFIDLFTYMCIYVDIDVHIYVYIHTHIPLIRSFAHGGYDVMSPPGFGLTEDSGLYGDGLGLGSPSSRC